MRRYDNVDAGFGLDDEDACSVLTIFPLSTVSDAPLIQCTHTTSLYNQDLSSAGRPRELSWGYIYECRVYNRMPDAQRWQIRHSFLGVLSEAGRRRCSLVSCLRSGRVVLRMRVSLPSSDIQTYRLHSSDVSEDLRRDYEISWWKTCREVSSLGKIFVTLLSNAFREETPPRIIRRRDAKS